MIQRILTDLYYLFYDTEEMIALFPSVDFTQFSEFELFISTLTFNIVFILTILLFIYVALKCLYKLVSWIF